MGSPSFRAYRWITLFFVLSLAVIYGLDYAIKQDILANSDAYIEALVSAGRQKINDDFKQRQEHLLEEGQRVITEPTVLAALIARYQSRDRLTFYASDEALVRFFTSMILEDNENESIEVFDSTGALVGWTGVYFQSRAPSNRFVDPVFNIADDRGKQQAIEVWVPIWTENDQWLGTVRVSQRILSSTPPPSSSQENFDISLFWKRRTALKLLVWLGPVPETTHPTTFVLETLDKKKVGRIILRLPDKKDVLARHEREFGHYYGVYFLILSSLIAFLLLGKIIKALKVGIDRKADGRWLLGPVFGWLSLFVLYSTISRAFLAYLEVPGRWFGADFFGGMVFDPNQTIGSLYGLIFESPAGLFFTLLFVAAIVGLLTFGFQLFAPKTSDTFLLSDFLSTSDTNRSAIKYIAGLFFVVFLLVVLVISHAWVVRMAVLNAGSDFFARTGLLPEPKMFVALLGVSLNTLSLLLLLVVLIRFAGRRIGKFVPLNWSPSTLVIISLGVVLLTAGLPTKIAIELNLLPLGAMTGFLLLAGGMVYLSITKQKESYWYLNIRSILVAVILISLFSYPLVFKSMEALRAKQLAGAGRSFVEQEDNYVKSDLMQVLSQTKGALANRSGDSESALQEVVANQFLAEHHLVFALFDDEGNRVVTKTTISPDAQQYIEPIMLSDYNLLKEMYNIAGRPDQLVEALTGRNDPSSLENWGIAEILNHQWLLVHAIPDQLQGYDSPFTRIINGDENGWYNELALAEFKNGVLTRREGKDFGRLRISPAVQTILQHQQRVVLDEQQGRRTYTTYYRKIKSAGSQLSLLQVADQEHIVAARIRAAIPYDHLYYLLRLTVTGLCLAIFIYVAGLFIRWKKGLFPASSMRYSDKVQGAFLLVGIISVTAMGMIGQDVIVEETKGAIRSWLRQNLTRTEEALILKANRNQNAAMVIQETNLDSLALYLGIEMNVFDGPDLVKSNLHPKAQQWLADSRLPIHVYQELYFEGLRSSNYSVVRGNISYTTGYKALADAAGRPNQIIAIPALSQQGRINEERSRTSAYLFGALLALLLAVMMTATALSRALATPMRRLRLGLEAVSKGDFHQTVKVETRDEVGELLQTFNVMQEQLAEQRRRLAKQERELAWREMAKQIAHEIKNPLTPMKLNIQQLERSFPGLPEVETVDEKGRWQKFAVKLRQTRKTLVEQIDTLARIANEFSGFARMPVQHLEILDLNLVVNEAVALFQSETEGPNGEKLVKINYDQALNPLLIEVDRDEIRRVVVNVIKNAIEATKKMPAGEILIQTTSLETEIGLLTRFSIKDNGLGIPEDQWDKIFEPNFSTKNSGTGLGLAISMKSIVSFNGEMGFDRTVEEGALFWIELPQKDESIIP